MPNTALITGASSGIGRALAQHHAALGGDLVLVARSEDKLVELKQELAGVRVSIVVEDLSVAGAAQRVFDAVQSQGLSIDILINNAGVGGHGAFASRDLAKHQAMMQLNMVSLTELTHLFLQGMLQRGEGRILNVSSTASFLPGPLQAVYYATKAYVTSFSQAIANELEGTGVTVTALCPGAVKTGFQAAGDLDGVNLWDNAASPEDVAAFGYEAMQQGELVVVNDPSVRFMSRWVLPLMPRKKVLEISRRTMEKSA